MNAEELLKAYAGGQRYFEGADLKGANLKGAYLRSADLGGADLGGAYLRSADLGDANLGGANLRGANLKGADLGGAYLEGADLGGANLGGANLGGANFRYANLKSAYLGGANLGDQWIIQGPCRSDGYWFFLMRLKDEKEPMVCAGCRWLNLKDAKAHWEKTRGGTQLGNESLDILIWLERAMNLRGLK